MTVHPSHWSHFGVLSMPRLNRALARVVTELDAEGLCNERLANVPVYLVPFIPFCYGWKFYGTTGGICLPAVSGQRLLDAFGGQYMSLSDVLRHEYAHALADTHPRLVRSSRFRSVFQAAHDSETEFEHDPEFHFTKYAATNAREDFAEAFMHYLRHRGKLPTWHSTPWKRSKWRFIRELCQTVAAGRRRW